MSRTKFGQALSAVREFIGNSFMAILKGEFLLRLNIGRYFIHIIFTFAMMGVVIWVSLMIDNTLVKVEKNKETIHEMEIACAEKSFDVATLGRRATVVKTLKDMGSSVEEAEVPATKVER